MQLEHVQTRLREIQPCLAESRAVAGEGELQPQEGSGVWSAGVEAGPGQQVWIGGPLHSDCPLLLPGGHLRKQGRKLEKQRKVEVYADADEILQEEIKEYKVGLWS